MITFMKFTAVFLTEILNLLLICTVTTIMNCLWNYVALASISRIDNIYAASLRDFKLHDVVKADNAPLIKKQKKESDEEKGICTRIFTAIHVWLKTVFFSTYFYFLPFATIGLSMLVDPTDLTQ